MVNLLDRLIAVEDIKKLKARYFRDLDTKDWDDLPSIFALDAAFDLRAVNSVRQLTTGEMMPPLGGEDQIFRGRATIVAMIRSALEGLYTVHHGHTPEIEITGATTARGIWVLEDMLRKPSGQLLFTGFGHYHETYENGGSGWEIKTSRLTRLYMDGGSLDVPDADQVRERS